MASTLVDSSATISRRRKNELALLLDDATRPLPAKIQQYAVQQRLDVSSTTDSRLTNAESVLAILDDPTKNSSVRRKSSRAHQQAVQSRLKRARLLDRSVHESSSHSTWRQLQLDEFNQSKTPKSNTVSLCAVRSPMLMPLFQTLANNLLPSLALSPPSPFDSEQNSIQLTLTNTRTTTTTSPTTSPTTAFLHSIHQPVTMAVTAVELEKSATFLASRHIDWLLDRIVTLASVSEQAPSVSLSFEWSQSSHRALNPTRALHVRLYSLFNSMPWTADSRVLVNGYVIPIPNQLCSFSKSGKRAKRAHLTTPALALDPSWLRVDQVNRIDFFYQSKLDTLQSDLSALQGLVIVELVQFQSCLTLCQRLVTKSNSSMDDRHCALCHQAATLSARLKRCSKCRRVAYCSAVHQYQHWPKHLHDCDQDLEPVSIDPAPKTVIVSDEVQYDDTIYTRGDKSICCLSQSPITTPMRGRTCRHVQCVDFHTYVTLCHESGCWQCPVCDDPLPWFDIVVFQLDTYLETIQQDTGRPKKKVKREAIP